MSQTSFWHNSPDLQSHLSNSLGIILQTVLIPVRLSVYILVMNVISPKSVIDRFSNAKKIQNDTCR